MITRTDGVQTTEDDLKEFIREVDAEVERVKLR